MTSLNGASRRASSSTTPQSRRSDRGSSPETENGTTDSSRRRSASNETNKRRGGANDENQNVVEALLPSPCLSSTNAVLIYCVLPIFLLVLSSYISGLIAGDGGGGGRTGTSPASQSPVGRGASGVTIDLKAAADASEEYDRKNKQKDRAKKQKKGDVAGGAAGGKDIELKKEIDALLEKQGKKVPKRDGGQKRQQRGGAASQQDVLEAARRRAQQQQDPRKRFDEQVGQIRQHFRANKSDIFRALALADALRQRDLTFHDGGSVQMEAIETYHTALDLIRAKRLQQIEDGEPTNIPLSGTTTGDGEGLNAELFLDASARSTDGLLASVECSLGKMYFMANMFEKAVEAYDRALELDADYLDALCYRASTLIILGRYKEAAENYSRVLELDKNHIFQDAYTGLAKILVAKESAVPGGWNALVEVLEEEIPKYEMKLLSLGGGAPPKGTVDALRDGLKRMHLALFSYHDTKTNNTAKAWRHLSSGYRHKMDSLSPWNSQFEKQRVEAVKQVFHRGFWPVGVGSQSRVPIFIIGFVRSGSTLTERVLDAHPDVVGTGEDSVFNGRLDEIRNQIVEASMSANPDNVRTTVLRLADMVVDGMHDRWEVIDAQTSEDDADEKEDGGKKKKRKKEPKRFVDKMLTNYMNVGFIHMLFPNALILHVARNPMDTCFSAFKHDFPPGTLDYTSDFRSLADLYHGYRDVMEHWDNVLPGRVTHIRYEDMVSDMDNVAPKIIDAAGLDWDDGVLKFHEKKQAVNTLSTTQVRKGVYKHHLEAWKKYEEQLQPLVKLLGRRATFHTKTTLPGYKPPALVKDV